MQVAQWAAAASHLLDTDDDHRDIASVPAESKINRTIRPIRQVVDMYKQGVTLYEPFGELAAGVEMLLGSGIPILRYIYSDTDSSVRAIAKARLQKLSDEYGPTFFPTLVWEAAFDTLFHDIRKVTKDDLYMAGAKDGTQWRVVAGWECQDMSPAGSGTGLEGNRSSTQGKAR